MKASDFYFMLLTFGGEYTGIFVVCVRTKNVEIGSSGRNSSFAIQSLTEYTRKEFESSSYSHVFHTNFSPPLNSKDGIVLVVTHESTGTILLEKIFQTWNAFAFSSDLLWWLTRLQKGRIVTIFVNKSGIYGLDKALQYLTDRGSVLVKFLPPNTFWIWIWVAGGKTLTEAAIPSGNINSSIRDLWCSVNLIMNKYIHSYLTVHAPKQGFNKFCDATEGLGNTCTDDKSISLPTPSKPAYDKDKLIKNSLKVKGIMKNVGTLQENVINDIGIVICAGNRAQYLNEAIKSLLQCNEIRKKNVFVVVGVNFRSRIPDEKVTTLLNLYGLHYQVVLINKTSRSSDVKYFNFIYYKEAWTLALKAFSKKKYLAFIDEDVSVSKNWMEYMIHTAPILDVDKSVWCVTASAAHGLGISSNHLLRGWRQVGWGFLLSFEDVQQSVRMWPDEPKFSTMFDSWLLKEITGDRECIFPAVSHSHHFGIGLNTIPELHERYFVNEIVSNETNVQYTRISKLTKLNYQKFVNEAIQKAKLMAKDPCAPGFLNTSDMSSDYVFYFPMKSKWSCPEWTFLAECIGTWPYSTHGMHEGTMQIPLSSGKELFIVGVPFSPYSVHMPPEHQLWNPFDEEVLEKQMKFTSTLIHLPDLKNKSFVNLENDIF